MNKSKRNYNKISELPDVEIPLGTKERMLNNILEENDRYECSFFQRIFTHLKPIAFAASMIFLLFFVNSTVGIIPQSGMDEFEVNIASNVEGAEVFLDGEKIGKTPLSYTMDKEDKTRKLTVRKSGYLIWQGQFDSKGPQSFVQTFHSSDEFSLLASQNSVDIESGLKPANPNLVKLQSNTDKTSVILNNMWVGEAPITLELKDDYMNKVELIAPDREKITLTLTTGDELEMEHNDVAQLRYSDHGYSIQVNLEDLWIPKHSIWVNENIVINFLKKNNEYKAQAIDLAAQTINDIPVSETLDHVIQRDNYTAIDEASILFEQNNQSLLNISEFIEDRVNIHEGSFFRVQKDKEIIIKDAVSGKIYSALENNNYKVLNSERDALYLWSKAEQKILLYSLNEDDVKTFSLKGFPEELDGLTKVQQYKDMLILLIGDEMYFKENGEFRNPEGFNNMKHFSLDKNGQRLIIFMKENYINIWEYHLEKQNFKKLY
ncbi:PEGA domain-containing protein [Proteinivorax hydrogeniformans]|uniref:PEGA domain-containing protein n=1 Tax=Proteinivorax hydrogeniformans TaxID=1826727 RepID=A0AAU8HVV6_9FIRM